MAATTAVVEMVEVATMAAAKPVEVVTVVAAQVEADWVVVRAAVAIRAEAAGLVVVLAVPAAVMRVRVVAATVQEAGVMERDDRVLAAATTVVELVVVLGVGAHHGSSQHSRIQPQHSQHR